MPRVKDWRSLSSLAVLLALSFLLRPEPPVDTRYAGGSVSGALQVLAMTGTEHKSRDRRAFDEHYSHWADDSLRSRKDPLEVAGLRSARSETPVLAGLVGIATVTGLRDLAAVCLYLLSDHAEHEGDWELCDLALRAIPYVDPHFVDAYLIRAFFFRKSDPDEAERILLRGVKWNKEDWELWNDLAWLNLRPNTPRPPNPEKALRYLEAAVAVKHPYKVRRLLAYVLAHLGRWKEAEKVLSGMLAVPGLSEADRRLAARALSEVRRRKDRLAERFAVWKKIYEKHGACEPACCCHGHHHHHHHEGGEHRRHDDAGHDHSRDGGRSPSPAGEGG